MARRYGEAASRAVHKEMSYRKRSGKKRSRKQAIAIGLNKARRRGAKVPSKRRPTGSTTVGAI